jgi:hypothetical protein
MPAPASVHHEELRRGTGDGVEAEPGQRIGNPITQPCASVQHRGGLLGGVLHKRSLRCRDGFRRRGQLNGDHGLDEHPRRLPDREAAVCRKPAPLSAFFEPVSTATYLKSRCQQGGASSRAKPSAACIEKSPRRSRLRASVSAWFGVDIVIVTSLVERPKGSNDRGHRESPNCERTASRPDTAERLTHLRV